MKSSIMNTQSKVWYITGASKGLGLNLVKQLLAAGIKVAATSRNLAELTAAVNDTSDNFLPLTVDITNELSVQESISKAVATFGKIDVVVNNAGYGLIGSLEELSDQESRANFEVNVFGTLNVIRQVMPQLRKQQCGHIFNISSIGGFNGNFPGFGIYCATKFAVTGLSESLAAEVEPFGVNVTVVMPGYFRTNFLSSTSLSTPENEIQAYSAVRELQKIHELNINGCQNGDPEKAAAAIISISEVEKPPLHLYLGQDAYDLADHKILTVQNDMDLWEEVATATAFDAELVTV